MIRLINKEGMEILLNVDSIQAVEPGRHTVITLVNGEKLLVKNHPQDIVDKIRAYQTGIHEENDPESPEKQQKE